MLDDRKLDVLRAIVEDFVATHEPVGSKALVDRHRLGVSSATIRNDMAVLEEEGLITQPHTSAGRIPTDAGYRMFVDRLTAVKPLSSAERRAIETFLDGAVDLDDVVHRTVRLLAQVTRQVAVVQYPSLTRSVVKHVEIVSVSTTRVVVVVIADSGTVEQRLVDLAEPVDDEAVAAVRAAIVARITNVAFSDGPEQLREVVDALVPEHRALAVQIASVVMELLVEGPDTRVLLAGTANLARSDADLGTGLRPVLEALEEQVVLLRLIGERRDTTTVDVRIGGENDIEQLRTTSLVATGYGPSDEAMANLGVIGPTRMDYPGTMAAVHAVARYVGRILAGG